MSKQPAPSTHIAGPEWWGSMIGHRFGGAAIFVLAFLAFAQLARLALTVKAWDILDHGPGLLVAYGIGFGFDLLTALLAAIPLIVVLAVTSQRFFASRLHRTIARASAWIGLFVAAFVAAAEWVFWHELGVRFNFVAVDYLVYTNEVVGNIWQSYPMPAILIGLSILATVAHWLVGRTEFGQ